MNEQSSQLSNFIFTNLHKNEYTFAVLQHENFNKIYKKHFKIQQKISKKISKESNSKPAHRHITDDNKIVFG